jgi:hypothetical protein
MTVAFIHALLPPREEEIFLEGFIAKLDRNEAKKMKKKIDWVHNKSSGNAYNCGYR